MAEIASHLDMRSLLRLRLVSRHFSSLSHLPLLELEWDADTASADGSLALFIHRHCALPNSPSVILKVENVQMQHWCILSMACACANLRKLWVIEHDLHILEAEALVRLLPNCLEDLRMATHAKIVDDVAMARLDCLEHLMLKFNIAHDNSTAYAGKGITCLPKLQRLNLEPDMIWASFLDAPLLRSTSLQQLQISGEPFIGRPDLENALPSLQEIWLMDGLDFPAWLHGQPVKLLKIYFDTFDPASREGPLNTSRLLCSHLELHCREEDIGQIDVQWLLNMPLLRYLRIRVSRDTTASLIVRGSLQPWIALLARVDVHVLGSVEIKELGCSATLTEYGRVFLRQNGHGMMCLCAACKHQHLDCHQQGPVDGEMK